MATTMTAVGYRTPGGPEALRILTLDAPVPGPHDLLVEVRASAVNPADPKIRAALTPQGSGPQVLGFDGAGTVLSVGPEVVGLRPGDEVYYAGALDRWGSNAERQVVDARIAALKPQSLDFAQAAALPLTALTAYELLFDRLGYERGASGQLLVLGGAGGVGSALIQIAKATTQLQIITTASRSESRAWVEALGADVVLDHAQDLVAEAHAAGVRGVDAAVGVRGVTQHLNALAELIVPQGRLGLVDDPKTFDIYALKAKSISLHWEFMFTRSLYGTADIAQQGKYLSELGALVDEGRIRSTLSENLGPLTLPGLRAAHARMDAGASIGKVAFEGFRL